MSYKKLAFYHQLPRQARVLEAKMKWTPKMTILYLNQVKVKKPLKIWTDTITFSLISNHRRNASSWWKIKGIISDNKSKQMIPIYSRLSAVVKMGLLEAWLKTVVNRQTRTFTLSPSSRNWGSFAIIIRFHFWSQICQRLQGMQPKYTILWRLMEGKLIQDSRTPKCSNLFKALDRKTLMTHSIRIDYATAGWDSLELGCKSQWLTLIAQWKTK